MEDKGYSWLRFADNIYIYAKTQEEAIDIYNDISMRLQNIHHLKINTVKSGIHDAFTRRILGYEFYRAKGRVEVRRHSYQPSNVYRNWHPCVVQKINREYHILQNGILNKQDYALLFENEQEKHHIPVEVVHQLNIYGEITLTSGVLQTISRKKIRVAFFDKYGNVMGYYLPERHQRASSVALEQYSIYQNEQERLCMAKKMEIAGLHNMRANLRYYSKRHGNQMKETIELFGKWITELNEAATVEQLLLIEARARQKYYGVFNQILDESEFVFEKRTKRPPKDELNALISFGNTLLYNIILQMIWKTSLDPKIGIVHATNQRCYSLNLDFADLFKPLIVDRVIFTLINCQRIKKIEHFEREQSGGVFLNQAGKKIFIEAYEYKLASKIVVKGREYTYRQLIEKEIHSYQKYVMEKQKYKPYKYY